MEALFTPKEVAARLRVSVRHLRKLVQAGELRYIDVGRGAKRPRMVFTESDLEAFIEGRTKQEPRPMLKQTRRKKKPAGNSSGIDWQARIMRNIEINRRLEAPKKG